MKHYLVKFNEDYEQDYFEDSIVLDDNGIPVIRNKNSDPWIVNDLRREYLQEYNAIVVINEIQNEEIKENNEEGIL